MIRDLIKRTGLTGYGLRVNGLVEVGGLEGWRRCPVKADKFRCPSLRPGNDDNAIDYYLELRRLRWPSSNFKLSNLSCSVYTAVLTSL
jgi:hypothetical protein